MHGHTYRYGAMQDSPVRSPLRGCWLHPWCDLLRCAQATQGQRHRLRITAPPEESPLTWASSTELSLREPTRIVSPDERDTPVQAERLLVDHMPPGAEVRDRDAVSLVSA